jgi:methylmalonyl-CoA mutase
MLRYKKNCILSYCRSFSNAPESQWSALVRKELGSRDGKIVGPEVLKRLTPEGIVTKPIYTKDDLPNELSGNEFPGLFPFTRGPYASM